MPNILLYDLETAPNISYTWGKFQQDVVAFEQEWYILSVAWKWLGEKSVKCKTIFDYGERSDEKLVKETLHPLLDQADIVVGHNAQAFDNRKALARCLYWQLSPPSPFQTIDTYLISRHHFAFNSHSLNTLCRQLSLGTKLDNGGFETWLGCLRGDAKAFERLKRYNKQDIVLLEKLYLRLRPFMPRHPNVAAYDGRPMACPKCGGGPLQARGRYLTARTVGTRYQCQACGGYCSSRTRNKTLNERV